MIKNLFKKKVYYIHIPKTGGTYLGQLESDKESVLWPIDYLGHTYVIHQSGEKNILYVEHDPGMAKEKIVNQKKIAKGFVFSTVRNIYDWLASYAGHAGAWPNPYVNKNHYDYNNAQRGFDYLINTIINRDTLWPNRRFIFGQLFSSKGDLVVDWINRTNSLDRDLEDLADHLRIQYSRKKKQRLGAKKNYREFYSDNLLDAVYKTWQREIKLFGFNFDKPDDEGKLGRYVDKEKKAKHKYFWKEDKYFFYNE